MGGGEAFLDGLGRRRGEEAMGLVRFQSRTRRCYVLSFVFWSIGWSGEGRRVRGDERGRSTYDEWNTPKREEMVQKV